MVNRAFLMSGRRSPALLVSLAVLLAAPVLAQSTPPASSAPDAKPPLSDADRAKRDADKVFQWIKFHAEKGESRKAVDKTDKHDGKPDSKPDARAASARPATAPARQEPVVASQAAPSTALPAAVPASLAAQTAQTAQSAQSTQTAQTAQTAAAPSAMPSPATQRPVTQLADSRPPELATVALVSPSSATPAGSVQAASPARAPAPPPVALPEEDESPLKLVHKVEPEYPRELLAAQRTGSVAVRFTVQPDGSVKDVEAIKSPHRRLGTAAVNAVRQWRFEPIPQARKVGVEIGFQVE